MSNPLRQQSYAERSLYHDRTSSTTKPPPRGKGADLIVDVIDDESVSKSLSAIRCGGQVVIIGILGDTSSPPDLLRKIMMNNALVQGVTVGAVVRFRERLRLLDLHKIKLKVSKVFEFEKTKEAFACLEKQDFVGKVTIQAAKD